MNNYELMHRIGKCSKCGENTLLTHFCNDYWLCLPCYVKEEKAQQEEFEMQQAEFERELFENPELYFCDDVSRTYLDAVGYFDDDD